MSENKLEIIAESIEKLSSVVDALQNWCVEQEIKAIHDIYASERRDNNLIRRIERLEMVVLSRDRN